MTEERFWDIVESYHWGDEGFDHRGRKVELLHTMSFDEIDELRDVFHDKMGELDKFSDQVEGPSDDGWSDLRAHIIGLGRDEFRWCMGNVERIQERVNKYDYRESFSYVLPYTRELMYLLQSHYTESARRYSWEIAQHIESMDLTDNEKADIQKVQNVLHLVGQAWGVDMMRDVYNLFISHFPRESYDPIWASRWNLLSYAVPNLFIDMKQYILRN